MFKYECVHCDEPTYSPIIEAERRYASTTIKIICPTCGKYDLRVIVHGRDERRKL